MRRVTLFSESESSGRLVRMGAPLSIAVEFCGGSRPLCPVLGVVVKSSQGWRIFGVNNRFIGGYRFETPVSNGVITCNIDHIPLTPGTYIVKYYLGDHHQDYDVIFEAATFEVVPADVFGTGLLPPPGIGTVFLSAAWELENLV